MTRKEFLKRLTKARNLIRKGWCQGAGARTKNNSNTDVLAKNAVKFCASGAMRRAGLHGRDYKWVGPTFNIEVWNDSFLRTHAQVLAMFDNSIKALKR